jgi:uncharacterized OB-fold protein
MITMNKEGNPIIKTEARIPYELAVGSTWYRFFEGLKEEKIMGTKCPKCNRVLVPARPFCSRCFEDMPEWIEVSTEGVLKSWSLTDYEYFGMPMKPPFINGVIRLDGTNCNFLHYIGGFEIEGLQQVQEIVKNGMRVRAVWREEKKGGVMDIKHFAPT